MQRTSWLLGANRNVTELNLRDKTYVACQNMLFNVTGYEHPKGYVYGSLKYIDRKKWTCGYTAAVSFLTNEHPQFVSGQFIQIPRTAITKTFCPRERWAKLVAAPAHNLAPLHAEAIDLATALSDILRIPFSDFGITDSLLWGEGHAQSDIDLVVFGQGFTQRILQNGNDVYQHGSFSRPDPAVMTAPYSFSIPNWPSLLARKLHMGAFRGRLFSLRVVLTDEDLAKNGPEAITRISDGDDSSIEFEVANTDRSLCFPAVYRNAAGDELVDYSVVYEGVFRPGDIITANCSVETLSRTNGEVSNRFTIADNCQFVGGTNC